MLSMKICDVSAEEISRRLREIDNSIRRTGTYRHTPAELQFGAMLAWRNSNRCIGRHFWKQLRVFDCRRVDSAGSVFEELESLVDFAFNGGQIRAAISIFAPLSPGEDTPRVELLNQQLIRYACFEKPNGSLVGDPASLETTKRMLEKGWMPTHQTRFTPLPWLIQVSGESLPPYDIFSRRPGLLHEIELEHPEVAEFRSLQLKWYATPILSDMTLVIGGIVYPCAPFSGWYMGTEIGARNLADRDRYDVLESVAEIFNLQTHSSRSLWQDRALVELNRAILYSFDKAGVRIGDHHTLTEQFKKFCDSEEKRRCPVTGDWTWLVPPMSASQTPVFHESYDATEVQHTNFFYKQTPS